MHSIADYIIYNVEYFFFKISILLIEKEIQPLNIPAWCHLSKIFNYSQAISMAYQ